LVPIIQVAQVYWPNSAYLATSYVGTSSLAAAVVASARSHLYISQAVPNPDQDESALVASYRKALMVYQNKSTTSYASLEGYYIGTWMTQYMSKVWDANPGMTRSTFNSQPYREELLALVYNSGVSMIGSSYRMGPFGADGMCTQKMSGCHCNQGGRSVYGSTLNQTTGLTIAAHKVDLTFNTCGYQPVLLNLVFGMTIAQTGAIKAIGTDIEKGVRAAFVAANAAGTLGSSILSLITRDDMGQAAVALTNSEHLINDDRVFGMIAPYQSANSINVAYEADLLNVPIVGAIAGTSKLRVPFNPRIINVRASITEELSGISIFIKDELGLSRIASMSMNDTYGQDFKTFVDDSLRANGIRILGSSFYTVDSDKNLPGAEDRMSQALQALAKSCNQVEPQAIILLGLYYMTGLAIRLAHAMWPRCIFFITSVTGTEQVLTMLDPKQIPTLYASQTVPLWSDSESTVSKEYIRDLRKLDPNAKPSSLGFEAYIAGRFTVTVFTKMPAGSVARQFFQDAIFKYHIFDFGELHLGPFDMKTNTNAKPGTPGYGCSQGLHKVWLVEYSKADSLYQYAHGFKTHDFGEEYYCNVLEMKCHSGSFRPEFNQLCQVCHLGGVVSTDGKRCVLCEAGSYGALDSNGKEACFKCPDGSVTSKAGETSCMVCGVGYVSNGSYCAIGFWVWIIVGFVIGSVAMTGGLLAFCNMRSSSGKDKNTSSSETLDISMDAHKVGNGE